MPLLETKTNDQFITECLELKKVADVARLKEERVGKDGLIHPQYVTALLNKYADDDAFFTGDAGSSKLWMLRHIDTNGKRKMLCSLLHGTMANSMPQALGIKKAFPDRQVIALCGDGGLSMLLGDLLTIVQENLPIKIVVFNNHSLNFVELEQKVDGLLDNFTKLTNPDFGKVAEAIGIYGITQKDGYGLEEAMQKFLAHDGPALIDIHTNPVELVMPPEPNFEQVKSTSLYAMKAVLAGRAEEVKDLIVNNFIK